MTMKSPSALDSMPLPEPMHDPQAARDFVDNIPALLRRLSTMSKRGRAHLDLSLAALSNATIREGRGVSVGKLHRMEHAADRVELDLIATLYLFALYGYNVSDLYPLQRAAATIPPGLLPDEEELVRAYRRVAPAARTNLLEFARFLAVSQPQLPTAEAENVTPLLLPAAPVQLAAPQEQGRARRTRKPRARKADAS
jgi:hypothetical protein